MSRAVVKGRGRRRYTEPHRELDVASLWRGVERTETDRDGMQWRVREVTGSDKTYRCPGCQQEIQPGTAHLVAWNSDHIFGAGAGLAERRHWHNNCWRR
ncbi:MAG: hypothetical protein ACK5H2_03020 [Beutenbergiaceae bacterium]